MSCGLTTSKYFLQNDGYQRAENYQPGNYREQNAVPIYGERGHDQSFSRADGTGVPRCGRRAQIVNS